MEKNYPINGLRAALFFILILVYSSLKSATLPSGFAETRLATGLDPTGIEISPDGRVFIVIKSGKVLVYKNGTLNSAPFLNITVDNSNERGLQSIAFDPNFSTNNFVYAYYTVSGTAVNRVSRFTASGDAVVAGSEVVLIETDGLVGSNHNGGALFFKDGKLFITTGESGSSSLSQNMNNLLGKVLRINSDGTIPTDNPFYSTQTGKYRSIYALGFRNPFKATIQSGTGKAFVNDVGAGSWEEVNELIAGKNYGWPSIEGKKTSSQTAPANYQDPLYVYGRGDGCSITGGAFYNPTSGQFPSQYVGKYFFQDYCNGWIKALDPATGTVSETFATGINRPIDIETAPDGSVYYLARGGLGGGSVEDNTSSNNGELWKVQFTGSGAPTISAHPADISVTAGGSATFVVGASGNGPLSYQWQKNNVNISGANSSTYTVSNVAQTDSGAVFRAVVTNTLGSATSNGAKLIVSSNSSPSATIITPVDGVKYTAGQTLSFEGTAADAEDGTLPASAFTWKIDLHHDTHFHPALSPVSGSKTGSYVIPTTVETSDNVWYRIHLTVTDSKGAARTIFRDVYPNKANVTLATSPSGLQLELDGSVVTAPYTFTGVVGVTRSISAVTPQTKNGLTYQFSGWSDGGAASHDISTPSSNTTYTATFTQVPRDPENPATTTAGLEYKYYEGAWSVLPAFNSLTPIKTGTINSFDLTPKNRVDDFGFVFTGYINIATQGSYTFYTSSDDGSQLFIGNTLVVNNDGLHGNAEQSGSIVLKPGNHAITVTMFEHLGDEVLSVSYEGPGVTKQVIPATVLSRGVQNVDLTLEAENAVKSGVQNSTLHSGYTGTGFGDYINPSGDYIEWTANVPTAGNYNLQFRYGLGTGTNRPLEIKVNGSVVSSSLSFPNTSTWTNWSYVNVIASLVAGNNTIRATAIGSSGANVDHLKITNVTSNLTAQRIGGEEPNNLEAIILFPVPVKDVLKVKGQNKLDFVKVASISGAVVVKKANKINDNEFEVNVGGLRNGLYLLTLKSDGKVITRKVLIER